MRVKAILVSQIGADEKNVVGSAKIVDDLGAESLKVMELIMAFEQEFSITIPEEDIETIQTVSDAVLYVTEKTS
jgi:acyl carrier protein